jgi:hypothetical protein
MGSKGPNYAANVIRVLPRESKQKMARLSLQGITLHWDSPSGVWRVYHKGGHIIGLMSTSLHLLVDAAWKYAEDPAIFENVQARQLQKQMRLMRAYAQLGALPDAAGTLSPTGRRIEPPEIQKLPSR